MVTYRTVVAAVEARGHRSGWAQPENGNETGGRCFIFDARNRRGTLISPPADGDSLIAAIVTDTDHHDATQPHFLFDPNDLNGLNDLKSATQGLQARSSEEAHFLYTHRTGQQSSGIKATRSRLIGKTWLRRNQRRRFFA